MSRIAPTHRLSTRLALACLLAAPLASQADGSRQLMPAKLPPAYAAECAACHLAYPPGLLPARSWQRLMGNLGQHYGSDAALDAATVAQLSTWLQANAGTYKRVGSEPPPQDRITRSDWFERKHHEINPGVWRLASVKSAANCAACHGSAEQGNFSEHALKLPAGVPPAWRGAWND